MADLTMSPDLELAPEPPPKGPAIWLRDNLFSTPASGVMSVASIALIVFAVSGLLNFLFAPNRRWDAVTFNLKLLMVQAYPADDLWRMWLAVGIVAGLLAATFAVWRIGGMAEPRSVGKVVMGLGGGVVLGGVLILLGQVDAVSGWVGVTNLSTTAGMWWMLVGFLLLAVGYGARVLTGDRAKEPIVPVMGLIVVLILIGLALIWTVDVPVPAKVVEGQVITNGAEAAGVRGEQTIVFRPIASSTTGPWTVIAAVAVILYLAFKLIGRTGARDAAKRTLVALWVMSFPVLLLVLLREPEYDWDKALSTYLPAFAVFGIAGALILWFVARPSTGELGRVVGAFVAVLAFASFFLPMPFVIRFLFIALALFALAGPTFGGEGSKGLIGAWLLTDFLIVFFVFITTTPSAIDVPGSFFLGGLSLTILLAFTSIVLSFPLGVLLALGRTSTMPLFRLLSTAYIELVRGVPLITWLLVAFLMLPVALPQGVELGGVVRAIGAMTFFSAAYLAENVRGGLQSIPGGQNEAAKALGMSTIQMTVFITLPQALRAVIPALVGQVIALFKDTSLVTIVGLFDFLHMARAVIPSQSQPFSFLGSIKETLIFAALVYWLFTFTFSRISLRLEKRLGVGER